MANINDLDSSRLTATQQAWVGRRGETIQVRTAGGRVMDTDVPKPPQRFKQFCYAIDARLVDVIGERRAAAQEAAGAASGTGDNGGDGRPGDRASRDEWNAYAESRGIDPGEYETKADLISAVDQWEA
jgi:hypothetical protein